LMAQSLTLVHDSIQEINKSSCHTALVPHYNLSLVIS
jgi:hypothetical protein